MAAENKYDSLKEGSQVRFAVLSGVYVGFVGGDDAQLSIQSQMHGLLSNLERRLVLLDE